MDRRSVHRYVAATAKAAGITRPHRPTRSAPNRRYRRAQPGHPTARRAATATPRPPRDHPGQLRRLR
jgi:hypothetical protein